MLMFTFASYSRSALCTVSMERERSSA